MADRCTEGDIDRVVRLHDGKEHWSYTRFGGTFNYKLHRRMVKGMQASVDSTIITVNNEVPCLKLHEGCHGESCAKR